MSSVVPLHAIGSILATAIEAVHRATTTRLFQNPVLERLSRIHPLTPFLVWLPIAFVVASRAISHPEVGLARTAMMTVLGILSWTLTEYVLHRFAFHWVVDSPLGKRLHFLIHGVHHRHPRDPDRVVMPLLVSLPVGGLFGASFFLALGPLGLGMFVGFVFGYLAYDGLHWAVHQRTLDMPVLRHIRRHHLSHHAQEHRAFGVSSPLWDWIFRTMPRRSRG